MISKIDATCYIKPILFTGLEPIMGITKYSIGGKIKRMAECPLFNKIYSNESAQAM